jgi:type I restriction enzyme, S subunit
VTRVPLSQVFTPVERTHAVVPSETYPLLGVRSFAGGAFASGEISGAETRYARLLKVATGDFVYPKLMAWEGAFAFVPSDLDGRFVSPEFCTFEVDESYADSRYLSYLFQRPTTWGEVAGNSTGTNVRRRRLYPRDFLAHGFELPPITEQRAMASRLDAVLGRVDAIEAGLHRSKAELILALYPALVERHLEDEVSRRVRVGDLVEFVNDLVRPGDRPDPADAFVGLQHVESHTGKRLGELPLGGEKGRKFRFRPGDIVYGYLRPYLNKVWVADIHGLCSVDQYVLRPKDGVPAAFLAHALRSRATLARAVELTHNLQLPRLRSALLADIEIPMPATERIDHVCHELDRARASVLAARDLRIRQVDLARALRESVLNRAFAMQA